MSSFEVKKNQELDFQEIQDNAAQFYEALTEYLILKDKHEEPSEAENLRKQAEETLRSDEYNYVEAFSFINTALKIFKVYNNLSQ
ncbi:MAG: hypothetical protein FK732_08855 [Asgard group archaeon]|nr:hypothetical protein [Asgard group archaeon]